MKTNNVLELLKAKGVQEANSSALSKPSTPSLKKRRLYQSFEVDQTPETEQKPTKNLRTFYGKPTDEIYGHSTENLRTTYGQKNSSISKPTDKPTDDSTDILRKTYGKPTDTELLVGFQRMIFFWLVLQAKELGSYDDNGDRITPPLNGNTIASSTFNMAYKQVKDVIYELKVAGYIQNHKVKTGRGGFVQYRIKKDIYQASLLTENFAKPTDILRKTYGKPTGKPTDKPTDDLSSSSSYLIKETTTTEGEGGEKNLRPLFQEFQGLCEKLGLAEFNIDSNDVMKIWKKGVFREQTDFSRSLEHVAFYLKTPDAKTIKSPKAWFYSELSQGYYGAPVGFKSWEERNLEAKLQDLKREQEAIAARKEELMAARFEAWLQGITPEKLKQISSSTLFPIENTNSPPARAFLKEAFLKELGETLEK